MDNQQEELQVALNREGINLDDLVSCKKEFTDETFPSFINNIHKGLKEHSHDTGKDINVLKRCRREVFSKYSQELPKGFTEPKIKNPSEDYGINESGVIISKKTRKIMTSRFNHKGYLVNNVSFENENGGRSKVAYNHRLVALTFLDNPDNKPQVNHKDGNKTNNHVSNLEWVTNQENQDHCKENNLHDYTSISGTNNYQAKLTLEDVGVMLMLREEGYTVGELSKIYGISKTTVKRVLCRKSYLS